MATPIWLLPNFPNEGISSVITPLGQRAGARGPGEKAPAGPRAAPAGLEVACPLMAFSSSLLSVLSSLNTCKSSFMGVVGFRGSEDITHAASSSSRANPNHVVSRSRTWRGEDRGRRPVAGGSGLRGRAGRWPRPHALSVAQATPTTFLPGSVSEAGGGWGSGTLQLSLQFLPP